MRSGVTAVPRWWPGRVYYGWALVGALGVTATVSYGTLSYAFSAFITPMSTELGWSKTQITGAFSLAHVVAGVAAVPVGRWVDRHGARMLMAAGSLLASLLLIAWSGVRSLPTFYAVWATMGVAMAAVLYEPAFAVVATWFRTYRSRALTLLTFMGGFASVIFVPLATVLVAREGWRTALLALSVLYALLTIPMHALLLRRRPEDVGLAPDGVLPQAQGRHSPAREVLPVTQAAIREVLRGASFRWTALAFMLSALATTAVSVHVVPLLMERGHGAAFAGSAMGVLGLMALPGRLIFTPLGGYWSRGAVTASIFALQAVGLVCLLAARSAVGVWVFVVLFGAGFGAITPARAALIGDLVPASMFGSVYGTLALIVSLARAAAPVGASVIYAAAGGPLHGYDTVLAILIALCIASTAAVLIASRTAAHEVSMRCAKVVA